MERSSSLLNPAFLHPFQFKAGDYLVAVASILLILKLILSYRQSKRCENGKDSRDVYKAYHSLPGPTPLPVIGNALILPARRDIHKKMDELYEKYGPCYRIRLFNEDIVVVNTAPLAQALLGSYDLNHFRKGESYEIYFNGTQGLPMLTGEKYKTRRKVVSESFKYRAFQRYNPSFNRYTNNLIDDLDKLFQDGKEHTIIYHVKECIFKQSSEAIMGVDISGTNDGELFSKSLEEYLGIIAERLCKPWLLLNWVWQLHPLQQRSKAVFNNMVGVTKKVIDKHKQGNVSNGSATVSPDGKLDGNNEATAGSMIEVLLKNGVPEKEIFEEVAVTLVVAHDTTSTAVQSALFLLALHPHHQEICRAEVDATFGDTGKYDEGKLEYNALRDLKHLERCILESQRMLSIASILMRKLEAPLRLQEGLVIPAGVSVYVFPPVIHKNPEYFPDPQKFDPDRYLPEESRKRHTFAYLAFSAGPRNCLGTKLALIETKMIIAKILHKFVVTTPDKYEDVVIVPAVIPAPEKPVNFRFKLRD